MKKASKLKYTDSTVKLDASVVREISELLEDRQTLSGFVREAVQRDVRRRKMRRAAALYHEALSRDPAEMQEMEAWEAAPLASDPERREDHR